jgi:uncharacterized protein (DUF2141 family)
MKTKISFLTIYFIMSLFFVVTSSFTKNLVIESGKLTVNVTNIVAKGGDVRVAVFNSEGTFMVDKKYVVNKSLPVGENPTIQFEFAGLPPGEYAVTTYHDVNSDHRFDQNTLGIPVEPYGLSNNVAVKWRKPTFKECKFKLGRQDVSISLVLKKWKER